MTEATLLKEKMALEEENRQNKIRILRGLDTKKLVDMIPEMENKLEQALRAEASFRDLNRGFLSSGTSDCNEVKQIEARLRASIPEDRKNKEEREAWLTEQRTANEELSAAILRQSTVAFELENCRVDVEMAKKKLDDILRVLSLKTAQIEFLTQR